MRIKSEVLDNFACYDVIAELFQLIVIEMTAFISNTDIS